MGWSGSTNVPVMEASSRMFAPSVVVQFPVNAPSMAAGADLIDPILGIDIPLTSVPMTAISQLFMPSASDGQTIIMPAINISAYALAPSVSSDVNLVAPPMQASAAMLLPDPEVNYNIFINSPIMSATAQMLAPPLTEVDIGIVARIQQAMATAIVPVAETDISITPKFSAINVGYDGLGTGFHGSGSVTSATETDAVPSDANCVLLWLSAVAFSAFNITSVKLGGQTLSLVGKSASYWSGLFANLFCFEYIGTLPSGNQIVEVDSDVACYYEFTTEYFKNVGSVSNFVTNSGASGTTNANTVTISGTDANKLYVSAHACATNGSSPISISNYSGTQRYTEPGEDGNHTPMVVGDSIGNGGALAFTATNPASLPWAAFVVELTALASSAVSASMRAPSVSLSYPVVAPKMTATAGMIAPTVTATQTTPPYSVPFIPGATS